MHNNNNRTSSKEDVFPISATRSIRGSRRLVREKVLQILVSNSISNTPLNKLFEYIFFRDFNQDDIENDSNISSDDPTNYKHKRILSPEEIRELDADTAIMWREEDILFAKNLINSAIKSNDYVINILKNISENWGYDRISIIDKVLIIIAIAEFIYFEDIPVKVSINEAIDISKLYSTEKSTLFINGILDKSLNFLTASGKINKTGRGLK